MLDAANADVRVGVWGPGPGLWLYLHGRGRGDWESRWERFETEREAVLRALAWGDQWDSHTVDLWRDGVVVGWWGA